MQRVAQQAGPLSMRMLGIVLGPLMARFANMTFENAAYSSVYAATAPELAGETGLYLDPKGNVGSSSSISRDEAMATQLWALLEDLTAAAPERVLDEPTASP